MKNFCKRLGKALYRIAVDIVFVPVLILVIMLVLAGLAGVVLLGILGLYLYSILLNIYSIFDEEGFKKQHKKVKEFFESLGDK